MSPACKKISQQIDLTFVVPVYNSKDFLEKLVYKILSIKEVSSQIILVDDASTDGSREEITRLSEKNDRVIALFNKTNLGAGIARNYGFKYAEGEFTIFFDADDQLHSEVIPPTIAKMRRYVDVDVAMFSYRYERNEGVKYSDMFFNDQECVNKTLRKSIEVIGSLNHFGCLLRFTNYPWNKILRTERFRETCLKFGGTTVNNDILGHWHSLLFSRKILLTKRVICTHLVKSGGSNLTNYFSHARLQMFDALHEVYDLLGRNPQQKRQYAVFFWSLVHDLTTWARHRIEKPLLPLFDERYRELLYRIDLEDFARFRENLNPKLADRLTSREWW